MCTWGWYMFGLTFGREYLAYVCGQGKCLFICLRLRGRSFKIGKWGLRSTWTSATEPQRSTSAIGGGLESQVPRLALLWSCSPLTYHWVLSRHWKFQLAKSLVRHVIQLALKIVSWRCIWCLISRSCSSHHLSVLKMAPVCGFKKVTGSHSNYIDYIFFSDYNKYFISFFFLLEACFKETANISLQVELVRGSPCLSL